MLLGEEHGFRFTGTRWFFEHGAPLFMDPYNMGVLCVARALESRVNAPAKEKAAKP